MSEHLDKAIEAMHDLLQEADNLHDTVPNPETLLQAALPHLEAHFREKFAWELESHRYVNHFGQARRPSGFERAARFLRESDR